MNETKNSNNGARAKILRALSTHGILTIPELSTETTLTGKQVVDNACQARISGLLRSVRDDVTQQLAYQITDEGRKWITKNGKSAPEPEPVMGLPAEKSPAVTPPEMAQIEPPEEITIEDPAESTEVFPIEEVPTAMEEESLYAIDLGVGGTLEPCGTDRQMAIDRALHHAQVTRGSHRVYRLVPIGEAVPMVSAQFVAS